MRYDDMIGTVLDQPQASPAARAVAWVQIVDLIAQGRGGRSVARAYDFLRAGRSVVPPETRGRVAETLAGKSVPTALMMLFAEDVATIAAPLLSTARLTDGGWAALLPGISTAARGVLRNRRDLDGETRRALAMFNGVDLVLDAPSSAASLRTATEDVVAAPAVDQAVGVSISDLVARINLYRREQPLVGAASPPAEPATAFRFEADADGVIFWVDGLPRETIVGETVAVAAAAEDGHGVDGHVAGAFRRRSPFRDARLAIAGAGRAAGDWRVSAVPLFAPRDGRFLGYRGTGRRPRADEIAAPAHRSTTILGTGIAPDSLRQIVHELRTPLNAIVGFADMIEGEMLGPVDANYRRQARAISEDGQRLQAAIDDLDMAAQLESNQVATASRQIDPEALLREIVGRHVGSAADAPSIDVRVASDVDVAAGDPILFDRMFARLIAAVIGLARPGERIVIELDRDGDSLCLSVQRPDRLADRDERTMLDPGYAPDGDWPDAPLLGLGFSLRLVRNLAAALGGGMAIDPDQFVLRVPHMQTDAGAECHS